MTVQLDELDIRILAELLKNGRIPLTKLAKKLRVPRTTVNSRLCKLEELGLIRRYRAEIAVEKLGYSERF